MLHALLKGLLTYPNLSSVLTNSRISLFKFEATQSEHGNRYRAQFGRWGELKLENHPNSKLQAGWVWKPFSKFAALSSLKLEALWDITCPCYGFISLHGAVQEWEWKAQHGLNPNHWSLSLGWGSPTAQANLDALPFLAVSHQTQILEKEWLDLYAELKAQLAEVHEDEYLEWKGTYFPSLNVLNEVFSEWEGLERQAMGEGDACLQYGMNKLKALSENEATAIRMGLAYQSILSPLLLSDLIFKYFGSDLKTQPLEVFEKHFAFIYEGWKSHFAVGSLARAKTDEALRLLQANLGTELLNLDIQNLRLTEAPEQETFALHANEKLQKSLLWLLTLAYLPPNASDACKIESMLSQTTPEAVDQALDRRFIDGLAALYRGLFKTSMMRGNESRDTNLLVKTIFQAFHAQEPSLDSIIHFAIESSPQREDPKGDYQDEQQARFIGNALSFLKTYGNNFSLELQKRFEKALKNFGAFLEKVHTRKYSEFNLALLNHSSLIAEQVKQDVKMGKAKLIWQDKRWALTKAMHRLWTWLKSWLYEIPSKKLTLNKNRFVAQALEEKRLAPKEGAPLLRSTLRAALNEEVELANPGPNQTASAGQNQNSLSSSPSTETGEQQVEDLASLLPLCRYNEGLLHNRTILTQSEPNLEQAVWAEVLQESGSSLTLQFCTQASINLSDYDEARITFINPYSSRII